jgi:acetyl esterase/lipase
MPREYKNAAEYNRERMWALKAQHGDARMLTLDPALFAPDAISDETRAFNADLERLLSELPTIIDVGPEVVRQRRREGQGALAMQPLDPTAEWVEASALERAVPLRVFKPAMPARGVYVHIHGGGWTLGTADSQDQTLRALSDSLGIAVVSIEYRLAPENPWPAPADDCEAAALWIAANAEKLFGTDRMILGGESAGAHLSAVTMIRLRDRHRLTPFAAANLVYGNYDLSGTPSALAWGDRNLILSGPILDWFGNAFVGESHPDQASRRDPDLSPLFADLAGLPPALFTIGTLDPLLDDTLFMASRWIAAGNEADLAVYPGGVHAFDVFPNLPIAQQARARLQRFIALHL